MNINEKQMHCWKGYKKKGTKKLPSGKVVNNCVKESRFDSLVESILEEGSLLTMAHSVVDKVKSKKISSKEGINHLNGILAAIKDPEEKKEVEGYVKGLQVSEGCLTEKRYKVVHRGLGISDTTSVDIEDEKKAKMKAKQNVFGRLKSQGKISPTNFYKWEEATAEVID
jgi:hypothetical protein